MAAMSNVGRSAPTEYRKQIGAWVKARLLRNPDAIKIEADGLDLFVVRGVLTQPECAEVIEYLDGLFQPSTILGDQSDPEFRTSSSADLYPDYPIVQDVEAKLRAVIGIQPELGETVQGQRYLVGQQFKPHWDFFVPSEEYWRVEQQLGGQRTWTAMLYLNEPEEGGQTVFTRADVTVRPRTGNLLIWNNLTPEGVENEQAMHTGMKVLAGTKYVLTKWYREYPWVAVDEEARAQYY